MRKKCFESVIALCLIAIFSFMINGSIKAYGAEAIPRIQKIALEYQNVREGDTQTIDVVSRASGKIQYRVWIGNSKTGIWKDITKGFTKAMNPNEVLSITTPVLEAGDYTVSVWVKRAGGKGLDKRGFDTFSAVSMKCLKNNGQTPNIKLQNIKHNYSKGQLLEVNNEKDKNYLYKYSVYNVLKNKAVVSYGKNYVKGFSWKAAQDGMYLLKLKLKNIEKIAVPKIKKIALKDEKVFEGDTQTIDVFANFPGEIQYKVWLCNRRIGVWNDITNGFTQPIKQGQVFSIVTPKLEEGNYAISVWTKRVGEKPIDKRGFDNYSYILMNCMKKQIKDEAGAGSKEENKQSKEAIQENKSLENKKDSTEDVSEGNSNISDDKENDGTVSKDSEKLNGKEQSEDKSNVSNTKDVDKEEKTNNKEDKEKKKEKINSKEKVKQSVNEGTKKNIKDSVEIEYKEIITEEEITKLIVVGNPYAKPVVPPKDNSIYVANVSETSKLYIRSRASTRSSIVGYIYGGLQSINVRKRVGAYSYIETTDYRTSRKIRGYVPSRYIKRVQPRKDYSIIVDISDQYVYVYKNGKLLKRIICSTGKNATPTPIGTYMIGSRGSYFLTGYKNSIKCYNWVRFNYNYLFHSVLCTKRGQPLQSAVSQLGHKASHGCIRLPLSNSKWFYNTIPAGTLVTIRY